MTRLIVARAARGDLDGILEYLEREAGRGTALAYAERFADALRRVIEFPGHARRRPALGADTRAAIVYPYLLIYDYDAVVDTATLLRVLHGKRDITRLIIKDPRRD
ncbi:MAG: type II toxin-antitoxin system RelE/ParE family toxin [Hyphomicrobiaceae bacterium]